MENDLDQKEMLEKAMNLLKSGVEASISWDFDYVTFLEIPESEDGESRIDCYPTILAKLIIGDLSFDICRTFGSCIYINNNNLVTITFNELDEHKWEWLVDDYCDDQCEIMFFELIEHIKTNQSKLLLPEYEDVSEQARGTIQEEIDEYFN